MPSDKSCSSAPRCCDAEVAAGADGFDPFELHAAADAKALARALSAVAIAAGLPEAWSIAFRDPDRPTVLVVYASTHPGLASGVELNVAATDRGGAGAALSDATGARIPCSALRPLTARANHYGYLLLHAPFDTAKAPALDALARHLGLALFALQANEERTRRQDLDALKVSLMRQTAVVLRELDLERALYKLMELTVSTVRGEVGCIATTSRDSSAFEKHTDWGIDEQTLASLRLRDGRPLAELVAIEGMICLFRNGEEMGELADCEARERIFSLIALPLASQCGVRGCLVIANAPGIDSDAVELLKMVTDMCSTAIDNAVRHLDSMEREQLKEQLRLAGSIQQALLPLSAPEIDGAALAGCNLPCDDSSGDYYDYFRLDERRVGFVIADATGHGIGAALIATTARAALRALLHRREGEGALDLGQVLTQLNELAESDMTDDKFITLFIAVYDSERRALDYASAGHDPPMLVLRGATGSLEHLGATGLPLGMFPNMEYEAATVEGLAPGDVMLLMTDGVNEARNPAGEQFGLARVEAVLQQHAQAAPRQLIDTLIDELHAFTQLGPREDDITMVCMATTAQGGSSTAAAGADAQPLVT